MLPPRPSTRQCRFEGWAPGLLPPLRLDPIASDAVLGVTALVVTPPGALVLGTDDGRILAIDPTADAGAATTLREADGEPISGLALDGEYLYARRETTSPARSRVTRWVADASPLASPLEVLSFVHTDPEGRRGAGLHVADGLLWIPLGDGEQDDRTGPSTDPNERAGNLVRLDVSSLQTPHGYDIPADNPHADEPGPIAEAWAWGLRDPVACTQDAARQQVWCVDVGVSMSEANLVVERTFLGWPYVDGIDCQLPGGCEGLDTALPLGHYRYTEGDCGAGSAAAADGVDPVLDGSLVYADRCSGRVYAVRPAEGLEPRQRALLAELDVPLAAMAADPAGGLWAVDADGRIGRLAVDRPPGQFPLTLSDSGCGSPDDPSADLVPYTLNAPLWTDGAHKQRYLSVPPGEHITVLDDGTLQFPEASVLLKTFAYATDPTQPEALTPVETRVMIRRRQSWEFHTYAWDDAGTEATLLQSGTSRALLTEHDGAPKVVTHTFPSRQECVSCHGSGDQRALGPRLDQLDRAVEYAAGHANQLEALASIDLFDRAVSATVAMADYRAPEASAEDRARAYLHANCGHCHRPGGWVPPALTLDLRWTTPTADTGLCGVPPQYSSTFPATSRVTPGDPSDSLVWLRLSSRGPWQMPPVGTSIPDPHGHVVRTWIEQLTECP
ncbi:MAG: PQQ-dependent sugar dehydrogenase [Deltaproteobacteria bacterium]|nr:PQQ-dependent sugar dehydrogenase [Deltaproteobacteria bacterium]